ncbi:MAG TPA: TPM domain-containing protein [Flavobacteriales bacterium]|nr:hypothetical protein [Flavobacteriales bacterium]HRE73926.1 TPM domain-containing protein [Flavobacteriales bacterium]HRE97085.1 TPM domain-containing protein [Flavobacteriales bacterium]HRJ36288.1 TPM domain-containing protein [Flavobacteriales bacterium]
MKRILLFLLPILLFSSCEEKKSCSIPDKPVPNRLVNDFAGILSENDTRSLEQTLRDYSVSTTTDIAIVTTNELCQYTPAEYAFKIIDNWGIGKADKDNGLVILVVPKESSEDGKGHCFIATGRGLEGAVPDAVAKRIVEDEMIPHFKSGHYSSGIHAGVVAVMTRTSSEFVPQPISGLSKSKAKKKSEKFATIIALIGIVFFWFLISLKRTSDYSRRNHVPFWTGFWIGNSMGRHGGSWGGFSGGGGGGWGGFGGGSSGGGGAGGSW